MSRLKHGGLTIRDFIAQAATEEMRIHFTGHSLGGLLAPTYALWLYDELRGDPVHPRLTFSADAFAGPSAGNQAFADYTMATLKPCRVRSSSDPPGM